jgi:hypothetical protein
MLEPGKRLLYLEELRPPEGYHLDRAIATTFSLDLLSLLMAPISMVLHESQSRDELLRDPMAALEAIRRSAGRIGVFCQKGRISVPTQQQLLFHSLEHTVVQVTPPGESGVFHPKIWLMRFCADNAPIVYRFLCLSRNLTFDRSWDTALVLEGELVDRKLAYSRNHPLGDFIRALPTLADKDVPEDIQDHVDTMADEVRRVQFEVEPPFIDHGNSQSLAFAPIGIDGYKKAPKLLPARSIMVVSPFLNEGWLEKKLPECPDTVVVSRSDTLNSLSDKVYEKLMKSGTKIYVMDEASEPSENSDDSDTKIHSTYDADPLDTYEEDELSGLHAKFFVSEHNSRNVRWWTGSANATMAAFNGVNVEFLVGLKGNAYHIGVSKLLGEENTLEESKGTGAASLIALLQPYKRPSSPQQENATRLQLEEKLEQTRNSICQAPIKVRAVSNESGTQSLEIFAESRWQLETGIEGKCAPISLHKNDFKTITPLAEGEKLSFSNISTASLTCFVSFVITARLESQKLSTSFVLKLECEGFPKDRDRQILSSIIGDSDRFLKYLLYLISENDPLSEQKLLNLVGRGRFEETFTNKFAFHLPLFEELVRSFSRQPSSIDRISELVEELKACETENEIIPSEFLKLWDTFMAASKIRGEHESKYK